MEGAEVTRSASKICFGNNIQAYIQNRLKFGKIRFKNRLRESSVNVKMEAEYISYLADVVRL